MSAATVLGHLRARDARWRLPVFMSMAVLIVAAFVSSELLNRQRAVTSGSGARPLLFVASIPKGGHRLCQEGVALSAGAAAVQLTIGTYGQPGPALVVTFAEAGKKKPATSALIHRGWSEGPLTIPLRIAAKPSALNGTLCVRPIGNAKLALAGEAIGTPATVEGSPAQGRVSVTVISGRKQSLLARLRPLDSRLGRGNARWIGSWAFWVILALVVIGVLCGAVAIFTTEQAGGVGRAIPKSVAGCAGAAAALGLAWALLTPPFQVPDETSHVAYVNYLSQTGKLPVVRPGVPPYSEEERSVLTAIGFDRVIGRPMEKVNLTGQQERQLREVERRRFPAPGGNATTASSNPPLYYLLETPIALATKQGGLLSQVMAMRLLSVALLVGSVLFASLFARELLPSSPWTWTAAGLACAFQPTLGFISSGVNPDSLLFCAAAAFFLGVGRMCRHGLSVRRAIAVAGALAVALLTKPIAFALVPVAGVCFAINALKLRHGWLRPCAIGAATVVAPVALVAIVGAAIFDHPYFAAVQSVAANSSHAAGPAGSADSLAKQLSFQLQLFAPRLPFLTDQIPGKPLVDIWLNGLVGVFGWVDYGFSPQVLRLATRIFVALIVLMFVALFKARNILTSSWRLTVCCLLGLASVAALVGTVDYQAYISGTPRFEQARYLLPLLALYGGLFALAFKSFGNRIGRLVLPFLWMLVVIHTLSALSLTASRYYL